MNLAAADTETHLAQPGLAAPPIVCGSIATESTVALRTRDEWLDWLWARLSDSNGHLVGCNFAYDLACAAAARPELLALIYDALEHGRLHDIAIREALIDIARGTLVEKGDEGLGIRYGMRLLVPRYLGFEADKENYWRTRYALLESTPIEKWPWDARRYPMQDAEFTRQICLAQEGGPNLHDEPAQMRAAFALQLSSVWGLRTSPAAVSKLRVEVETEWNANRAEFQKAGIFRDDGSKDTKALGAKVEAAYSLIGFDAPKTPTGKLATDRDTLIESSDPVLMKLGRSGKNDKRKSTYLPMLEQGVAHPWNPQVNVLVATGRVSSDAQQFPRKGGILECFEARPGYAYCSVDYGGLELRTMSQRAIWDPDVGYSKMAEALNAGRDCHTIAAASFMGMTYEALLPEVKMKLERPVMFRQLGKIFNFGKGGGMGAGAMAYNARSKEDVRFCLVTGACDKCGVEKREIWVQGKRKMVCAACIDVSRKLGYGWLRAWPEQQELFDKAGSLCETDAVEVEVPISKRVRGGCGYTQWLNTPFQGLGADLVKDAMWLVSKEMHTDRRSAMWGGHLCLNVHDELIAEFPLDRASDGAERMAHIMRETAKKWLPDLGASIEAEPAIGRILSKSMQTVRSKNGQLLLWEPEKKAA